MTIRRLLVALVASALALGSISAGIAQASPSAPASAAKAKKRHGKKKRHRRGGRVRLAWPYSKGLAPSDPLARWLAKQSGPKCAKHRRKARKKARRKCPRLHAGRKGKKRAGKSSEALAVPSVDRGPKRYDASPVARIASSRSLEQPLALTRSYQIPVDDPSYNRLLNWSWTYDSAVTAAAFVAGGDKGQARQLLDQLAALQYNDGSIDIAFDVASGQGAGMFRTGTIAWVGLAATQYDRIFGVSTYRNMTTRAADYLLSLQGTDGLLRGGPELPWYSTQHNVLAYFFLGALAAELHGGDAQKYGAAAATIGAAIQGDLLQGHGSGTHFIQGLGDGVQPLDAQAYGALFELVNGSSNTASKVLGYAKSKFSVSGRSIVKSTDPATYNNTYSAHGPFSGYRPYLESSGPNVLWFEATPMLRLVTKALGQSTSTLDSQISSWLAITPGSGPLQADQALTNTAYGVEYHVWPSAAPAAWVLMAQDAPGFFTAD